MLEEPFSLHPSVSALSRRALADPFSWQQHSPALNLSEEEGNYVVEAELPGVKKENVDVRVGDGGRSLTIEGRIIRGAPAIAETSNGTATSTASSEAEKDTLSTSAVVPKGMSPRVPGVGSCSNILFKGSETQAVTYPPFRGNSTFTRTVWLPHPINTTGVKAKLEDGILTVRAPKLADQEAVKVTVD